MSVCLREEDTHHSPQNVANVCVCLCVFMCVSVFMCVCVCVREREIQHSSPSKTVNIRSVCVYVDVRTIVYG